jgi:fumarylacetoacetase
MTNDVAPSGLDETHDAGLRSWVASAHTPETDFPLQNLPFGVVQRDGAGPARVAIAIGDDVLDCHAAADAGFFDDLAPGVRDALRATTLNPLMAGGRADARAVRAMASRMLRADTAEGVRAQAQRETLLVRGSRVTSLVPAQIGDYTDFYASLFHATNVGAMFRPDSPLMPNYKFLPVGYHGRASSIVVSGTAVRRPNGQTRPDAAADPTYGPSNSLDYELEMGAYICRDNALGETVPLVRADDRLFGLSLLNDWSARDIQSWEYQPLGPFLAKNFATSVGAWIVSLDALAPFRTHAYRRAASDPPLLPYLNDPADQVRGAFDISLEVWLRSAAMRDAGLGAIRLSRGNFSTMYWTFGQMLAHHASGGCNLRSGDLLGSGTVSGAEPDARGCLLELTRRGADPIQLPSGERRGFLADGDEVILRGWCEREGAARIGFGECRGEIRGAT